MTALHAFFILALLAILIYLSNVIHTKRTKKQYIDSYRWYVKILK